MSRVVGDALHLLLDPALLLRLLDVHVLHADAPAVGVAQHAQEVAQGHEVLAGDAVGEELAVEVPDGEPVGGGVELGVGAGLLPAQRVEVGDEVAPHPVHVDQGLDVDLLDPLGVVVLGRVAVGPPPHRLVGDAERPEDVAVEAVGAAQQLVDLGQEQPRLGPLDHPVVVGGRQADHLGDAQLGQGPLVGPLELGRVAEGADAHDHALAGHEPGHRRDRAQGAGVGEGHGDAGEVVGRRCGWPGCGG